MRARDCSAPRDECVCILKDRRRCRTALTLPAAGSRESRAFVPLAYTVWSDTTQRGVLCAAFYADRLGRPKSASGSVFPDAVHRLFRGSVVGAGDCVAGGRFAESAVVPGSGVDRGGAGPLDAVAHAAADRRGDPRGGVHVGSGAAVRSGSGSGEDGRHRCDDAGSERGDAEHRAAGHGRIPRSVHSAVGGSVRCGDPDAGGSGSVRPGPRKNKKTSNKEWKSPQDPDAKIAKMKDGRTHLAHKAEHGVDMDTGAIVSVTVQDASDGDTATLPETLIMAAEQVELVQPDGAGVEEVVADKGYHSDETLVALGAVGVRSPRIGAGARPTLLAGQEDGRDAAGGSVLRRRRCMRTAGVWAGGGVVVCNAPGARWWSVLSRTCMRRAVCAGAFPISRSRAHTHRRHGHPLQTVPSAGLIERPQEKNRVDALR